MMNDGIHLASNTAPECYK